MGLTEDIALALSTSTGDTAARGGLTGTVLESITEEFDFIARPIFVSNATVVLMGLLPIFVPFGLQMSGKGERQLPQAVRHWGRAILILNVYFNPSCQVSIDPLWVCILVGVLEHLMHEFYKPAANPGATTRSQSRLPDKTLEAQSNYGNLSRPFPRVVQLFFCQACLMMFYIFHMISNKAVHDSTSPSYLFWLLAFVLTERVSQDEDDGVGASFNTKFWRELLPTLLQNGRVSRFATTLGVIHGANPWMRAEWICRCFFAWMVNTVFRILLVSTLPILLSTENSLDFIKDIVAVNLITRLDDMQEPKQLEVSHACST